MDIALCTYIIALNKCTIKLDISNFKNTVNDNYYTSTVLYLSLKMFSVYNSHSSQYCL